MNELERLIAFCTALAERSVRYELVVTKADAITLTFAVPDEIYVVEFATSGTIRTRRSVSGGTEGTPPDLDELLPPLGSG